VQLIYYGHRQCRCLCMCVWMNVVLYTYIYVGLASHRTSNPIHLSLPWDCALYLGDALLFTRTAWCDEPSLASGNKGITKSVLWFHSLIKLKTLRLQFRRLGYEENGSRLRTQQFETINSNMGASDNTINWNNGEVGTFTITDFKLVYKLYFGSCHR
jgi:hypothetical protein